MKNVRRRVSASSSASSPNDRGTSPEDTKLWNSLITRQSQLLESIKKGKTGSIPSIVELPESITVATPNLEITDCDPLSITDSSHEANPTFQDYCLQFYRSDDTAGESADRERGDDQSPDSSEDSRREKCLYEYPSEFGDSPDLTSNSSTSEDSELASMITEPLMEWDLEHDGIFEV